MKRAGLRGSSRKKTALYEQLTIPAHKFKRTPVPLLSSGRAVTGSVTTLIYQTQVQGQESPFNNRCSYMPVSYRIPTMASMPMPIMNVGVFGVGSGGGGGASAASSMNACSVRSTVADVNPESQRVPRIRQVASRRQNSSGHSKPSSGNKDGKEHDDFAVPTYSATQGSSQTRASGGAVQVQQGVRGGVKESTLEKWSGKGMDEVRQMRKERSMEEGASWTSASVECVTVSAVEDDVNTQEVENRKADGGRGDCNSGEVELNASEVGEEERVKEQRIGGPSQHSKATITGGGFSPVATDSVRAVSEQDAFSGQGSENQSGEVSEPSRPRSGSSAESELSMLEDMTSDSMCFREVVIAFGQQEFWKAQNTIMRQQKLFARQVFELHRVIEVQQLLAKTSTLSLSIDESLVEEEADNVPRSETPVADVPVVPEIPEADGSQSHEDNSRPVPEAVCQPIYPLSVPTQQDFNAGSAWQAALFGANPWAARMASPFTYVPYSGPGYGVYPTIGAPMPMYGGSGGIQGARFPSWQQPGMSQPWGVQEPVAATAAAAGWYGQQPVVPASMDTVAGAGNFERPASCAVSPAVRGSNAPMGTGQQAGKDRDGVANCSREVDAVQNSGWAKGWGSSEERVIRGEAETSQSKEFDAGPLRCEAGRECSGLETEGSWRSGVSHEGPLQNGVLKRPRTAVPQVEVSPWFRVISPSKRVTQLNGVIKVVPRAVSATPESAASILLSIQKERGVS